MVNNLQKIKERPGALFLSTLKNKTKKSFNRN